MKRDAPEAFDAAGGNAAAPLPFERRERVASAPTGTRAVPERSAGPPFDADTAPPMRPLRFLWTYIRRRPFLFGALLALIVAAAACSLGVQYGMKLIVDTMAEGDRSTPQIWRWLTLFVVLTAVEAALWRLSGWLGCHAAVSTGVAVRLDLFRHLSGHSLAYFSQHLVGSLGNRVTATAGSTAAIIQTCIWKVLPPCIDFVGAVIVIMTIDRSMALALLGVVTAVAIAMAALGIRARPLQNEFARQAARVAGELIDAVSNMWTVRAFSARGREYERLQAAFHVEAAAQRRGWLYLEKARAFHDVAMCLLAGGMLIWVLESWRAGRNEAGDVVLISALTFRILHGSRDLALSFVDMTQQMGNIEEMLRVVAVPHQVADRLGAPAFVPGAGEIRIIDATFAYNDQPPLFRGLDLHIPAGQRIGIVGPSGAGKSTLIHLIQRVADVQSGSVSIDRQDVRDVRQETLHQAIAVVPQDVALFHRPVIDNLRYGCPNATDAQVRAAAREAACDRFIDALPQGYDTLVGERGVRLSGGQRQRIGIARALMKDAPILLLDEATSALDSRSESDIQRALLRLMDGRTVVAVAHRLSTVSSFDRIVVIVDGRIEEDGTPAELRDGDGLYAEMWRLQAQGFDTA